MNSDFTSTSTGENAAVFLRQSEVRPCVFGIRYSKYDIVDGYFVFLVNENGITLHNRNL